MFWLLGDKQDDWIKYFQSGNFGGTRLKHFKLREKQMSLVAQKVPEERGDCQSTQRRQAKRHLLFSHAADT